MIDNVPMDSNFITTEHVWVTPYDQIRVNDRVLVVSGSASDMPDYRGETGTVVRLFEHSIEVELDHYGYSTLLDPLRLEVLP